MEESNSLLIRAHTYSMSGDEAFGTRDYRTAADRFHTAAGLYDKAKDNLEIDDVALRRALVLLSKHQRSRQLDMVKRQSLKENHIDDNNPSNTRSLRPTLERAFRSNPPNTNTKSEQMKDVKEKYSELQDLETKLQRLGESFCIVQKETNALEATPPKNPSPALTAHTKGESASVELLRQEIQKLREDNNGLLQEVQALRLANASRKHSNWQQEEFKNQFLHKFAALKLSMEQFTQMYAEDNKESQRKILEKKLLEAYQRMRQLTADHQSQTDQLREARATIERLKQKNVSA